MGVRIYRPNKSAMQSGRAGTDKWRAEFVPAGPRGRDPLMGWTSSRDTRRQVSLSFDSLDEAVAWAEREGHAYVVEPAHDRVVRPKSYSDNFRADRAMPWTH